MQMTEVAQTNDTILNRKGINIAALLLAAVSNGAIALLLLALGGAIPW